MFRIIWSLFFLFSGLSYAGDEFVRLSELKDTPSVERLEFWSHYFIGKPYLKGGPLGEGARGRFDKDPLYRFDGFDCTTFVETVLSLSLASSKEDFENEMNRIRYTHGVVSYENRNHITSHSWIPENILLGYFNDATHSFSEKFQRSLSSDIDLPGWYKKHDLSRLSLKGLSKRKRKKRLKELRSISEKFNSEQVSLNYLSIKEILSSWDQFKEEVQGPYVINIVKPNWNMVSKVGTKLNISHQGLLLKLEDGIYMLHASTSGKVVKIKLRTYLSWFKNSKTVRGINLLELSL